MKKASKTAYTLSNNLSDSVWELVQMWSVFAKTIIGNQFMIALDEVTVNLAKAAKASTPETQQDFLAKAHELLTECFIWNDKARRRKLLVKDDYQAIFVSLTKLQELVNKSLPH